MIGERTRVYLVDDAELTRRGVVDLLRGAEEFDVVGEAGTAAEALAQLPLLRPDVAVIEAKLPDGSGIDVCREIRLKVPEVNVLMLSTLDSDDALFDSIIAGAAGYVLKNIRGADLMDNLRTVAAGRSLLDPSVTSRVLQRLREGNAREERLGKLTDQERRILELIGEGLTNRQIAEVIHLAEKTVKNYVSNMLAKLGMERRTQAAAYAARLTDRQA
ncbi:MAG: two-component system, NarL family, response regulator DevR [Frankiaceae bacterium]|jgi:DNA-binding NarL/FixJ family response regulator|nr:two-component system, NarL family, response regulator DevR [Frankiaceae bacterium]